MGLLDKSANIHALNAMRPMCAVCNKKVGAIDSWPGGTADVLTIWFACHGKSESFELTESDWYKNGSSLSLLIPRRVFLRNWAEYKTTTKPERRKAP